MSIILAKLADIEDFEKISGNEAQTDLFLSNIDYEDYIKKKPIKHISIADLADDLLSTSIMATNAPVLICPAMNVKMWKNAIMQENVAKLKELRYEFVNPEYGDLACGYKGVGRLAHLDKIVDRIKIIIERRNRKKMYS